MFWGKGGNSEKRSTLICRAKIAKIMNSWSTPRDLTASTRRKRESSSLYPHSWIFSWGSHANFSESRVIKLLLLLDSSSFPPFFYYYSLAVAFFKGLYVFRILRKWLKWPRGHLFSLRRKYEILRWRWLVWQHQDDNYVLGSLSKKICLVFILYTFLKPSELKSRFD